MFPFCSFYGIIIIINWQVYDNDFYINLEIFGEILHIMGVKIRKKNVGTFGIN